jgi:hypothetical protein
MADEQDKQHTHSECADAVNCLEVAFLVAACREQVFTISRFERDFIP